MSSFTLRCLNQEYLPRKADAGFMPGTSKKKQPIQPTVYSIQAALALLFFFDLF
jgi:hypothetical protein